MLLGEPIRSPARRGRRIKVLRLRIDDISSALDVKQTTIPSGQDDVDRIHAFRLLCHSEIQAFIDGLANLVLDVTGDRSTQEGVLTHAGHHLLVNYAFGPLSAARTAENGRYPEFTPDAAVMAHAASPKALTSAINTHAKAVERNNGLKAGNVMSMLVPLGFRTPMIDTAFRSLLDGLGNSRGTVAHKSGIVGAKSWPSGSTEWTRILPLLNHLDRLERYVPRLLRAADS